MQVLLERAQSAQTIALLVGLAVLLAWESGRPFFAFFRGHARARVGHVALNLVLGALNSAVVYFGFAGLWLAAAIWAEEAGFGLLNALLPDGRPAWLHLVGAIVLLDAWTYLWHRLNHRVPFLWRFHRVHHADREMDVSTATRFHVGEIVFSSALRVPLIALFGVYAWELVAYETAMFAVVQLHHANVVLPAWLDRALRVVIVTPAMHKVHHSRIRAETDSNYSAFLSVWDRLGRSFRLRRDPSDIEFGLDEFDRPTDSTLTGLLRMPFGRERQGPVD